MRQLGNLTSDKKREETNCASEEKEVNRMKLKTDEENGGRVFDRDKEMKDRVRDKSRQKS